VIRRMHIAAAVALLSGCGAANTAAVRTTPEPACSFRAVTTCWTLAGRFPARQLTPPPEELRAPPRAVLASATDSSTARP
jgi:hypothetical protein